MLYRGKNHWMVMSVLLMIATGAVAQQEGQVNVNGSDHNIGVSYAGDDLRFGLGVDDDGDIHGEYFNVFAADEDSNWVGEMWLSESRGGLKASYHWLTNGSSYTTATDATRVGKAFFAVDQNEADDRKVTLGLGLESQRLFWGAYFMHSITGRRLVDTLSVTSTEILTGVANGQNFIQPEFTTNTTRFYEEGYDYGVGFRIGHYYEDALVRVRAGLDYEKGEGQADQMTVSLGLEKFFSGTGHSLDLLVEHYNKDGEFEIEDDDTRATLYYRYAFGNSYKPRQRVVEQQVESRVARVHNPVYVKNRATVSREALFDLDKYLIRDDAADVLDAIISYIDSHEVVEGIRIIGHTCDIHTEAYNLELSKNRANAVAGYLKDNGLGDMRITTEGRGESEPKYDNSDPLEQPKNRRVEIEFISLVTEDANEFVCPEGASEIDGSNECSTVSWERELVDNPVWLYRAMRNPVEHKRIVDTYRTEESETTTSLGDRTITNNFPGAVDDTAITNQDMSVVINVLANDTDVDNDGLTVTSVTQPGNGMTVLNGDGTVTYTPNDGFFGSDSFSYSVDDGAGGSDSADVTVTVREVPPVVANDDQLTTSRNQPVSVTISELVANDDTGNGTFAFNLGDQPANGQVVPTGNGPEVVLTYTPNRDFVGTDSYTYILSNSLGQESVATVTVTVMPGNTNPVAVDDMATTAKNTAVLIDVLANDSDADGDALTVTSVTMSTQFGSAEIVDNQVLYTPNPGWWGGDELTYTIEDDFGGSASATIILDVTDT